MEMWIVWLILAVVLIIVEVLSQQIWAICLTVGCFVAMILDMCGLTPVWQIAGLTLSSLLAFALLAPVLKRYHDKIYKKVSHNHRTGMDALLGRHAEVIYDIHPGQTGRVRIDGDFWQARAPRNSTVIPKGATVVVDSYESIILNVQSI